MAHLSDQIKQVKKAFLEQINKVKQEAELEQVRIAFLGRNGQLTDLMANLKTLSLDEKKEIGPQLNQLKQFIQETFEAKKHELTAAVQTIARNKQKYFDVTAYKYNPLRGTTHIYTQIINQLEDIFTAMGYAIVDGPEVETDYYNFETLNIPTDHPARDAHDTFWLNTPGKLLRTHTSSVQAHTMEAQGAPLAIFAPGRVYRNEATDASHDFMFTQGEGLFIDKDVSIAHLLATAQTFLKHIFEKDDLKIRVRPGYFPFVEPGLEIDASCPFCSTGCSVCKHTTWIELLGAGIVHPNVLRASNIDPEKYSGFAFGFGIERIAMIKYGINDIRLFHSSDLAFLNQF
ncbi:MAG TPA: phenylalanine--tRNA ligase subunit alpha [Candidatus Dependentiae bacterium]|nr:phenylalanine--tRNA ligase subunit alpha [Candidatus Dependentiae bacterium]HRQ62399.1 phenylalanine--tRNA ligase subunit alpha [Candidatus Dependentiae bacterium]